MFRKVREEFFFYNIMGIRFYIRYPINTNEMADSQLHMVIKILSFA